MTTSDLCQSIARLLAPSPASGDISGDAEAALDSLLETREAIADRLWAIWEGTDEDPLLVAISEACARRSQADRELRLLLAFGREFVRPRPYELAVLAEAGGLSASGAKTAYKREHVTEVASILERSPLPRRDGRAQRPSVLTSAAPQAALQAATGRAVYLYQQIAAELREQIRSGALPAGSRVPTVRQLMASYGVAMATARHGLQELIDEQLIYTVHGLGTFVGPCAAPGGEPR
ncbi:winged helix-turn-helix domain-containing protein [Streptomyces lydicus]|uniref:GntR family transcriptional regulator n=1 Tax=Streptomyces lydicus TaxID=47763 RepID=UPI0033F37701